MISVNVNIKGSQAFAGLNKLATIMDRIDKAVTRLNANLGVTATMAASAAGQMQRMAQTSGRAASSGRSSTRIVKPPIAFANDPLAGANYFRNAAAGGNPAAIKAFAKYTRMYDAQQRGQAMAQGAPGQLNGGNFAGWQAYMRTRFSNGGPGGGKGMVGNVLGVDIMRMLGQGQGGALRGLLGGAAGGGMGMAAGMAAKAGPAGLIVAGLLLEFKALEAAVKVTAKTLSEWTSSMIEGGGSPGQAAAASRVGNALGLGPNGLAQIGKNLSQGYGPIVAGMAGANPAGGPFGDNDYNKKGLSVVDMFANLEKSQRGFDQARRLAEMVGTPDLAKIALMDPRLVQKLTTQPDASLKDTKLSADFDGWSSVAQNKIGEIAKAFGAPAMKAIISFFQMFDRVASRIDWDKAASGFSSSMAAFELLTAIIERTFNFIFNIIAAVQKALGFGDKGSKKESAVDRNTRAVDANTQAMKEGISGGGARAQGAVPRGMNPALNPAAARAAYGIM